MILRDIWYRSAEGLKLHARDHDGRADRVPLLCLNGLTRNVRDFEPLAAAFDGTRRIVAMDYRGRGQSQYADDPKLYRPDLEAADAIALLDILNIGRAAVIGTSRGGIVALLMAAQALQRIAGILFNDIGPVLDKAGLLRIAGYVGKPIQLSNWDDAVAALKRTHAGFDTLSPEEWLAYARRIYREENGIPRADYDLRLGETLPSRAAIEEAPLPDMWAFYDALPDVPLSVLRGEHSDLLSSATVDEMGRRRPAMEATTVRNRGHVPFLNEPESLAAITRWLGRVDASS